MQTCRLKSNASICRSSWSTYSKASDWLESNSGPQSLKSSKLSKSLSSSGSKCRGYVCLNIYKRAFGIILSQWIVLIVIWNTSRLRQPCRSKINAPCRATISLSSSRIRLRESECLSSTSSSQGSPYSSQSALWASVRAHKWKSKRTKR